MKKEKEGTEAVDEKDRMAEERKEELQQWAGNMTSVASPLLLFPPKLCNKRKVVYAAIDRVHNKCKIGFSKNFLRRVLGLRMNHPYLAKAVPLQFINKNIDARKQEAKWHKKFAQYRIKGEWFRLEGEVERTVNIFLDYNRCSVVYFVPSKKLRKALEKRGIKLCAKTHHWQDLGRMNGMEYYRCKVCLSCGKKAHNGAKRQKIELIDKQSIPYELRGWPFDYSYD